MERPFSANLNPPSQNIPLQTFQSGSQIPYTEESDEIEESPSHKKIISKTKSNEVFLILILIGVVVIIILIIGLAVAFYYRAKSIEQKVEPIFAKQAVIETKALAIEQKIDLIYSKIKDLLTFFGNDIQALVTYLTKNNMIPELEFLADLACSQDSQFVTLRNILPQTFINNLIAVMYPNGGCPTSSIIESPYSGMNNFNSSNNLPGSFRRSGNSSCGNGNGSSFGNRNNLGSQPSLSRKERQAEVINTILKNSTL